MVINFRTTLAAAALALTVLVGAPASALDVYLRAGVVTKTMPDGEVVTFWGFARDSAFGAMDGTLTVPGPELRVPRNDPRLVFHVDNDLPEPVSIQVPGQRMLEPVAPVRLPDGRVRSFVHETPPGNTTPVTYTFVFNRGSFLYHSATHPAVQVQMGLYGAAVREQMEGRRAYPGTPTYSADATVFLSEVDPVLHEAVATGQYGPGGAMTSTVDYAPRYFLVNGEPFDPAAPAGATIPIAGVGERTLLRFFSAGLTNRVPTLLGARMSVIAEDGHVLPFPRDRVALLVPALKTFDAFVQPAAPGRIPLFDRRLGLQNGGATGAGGMLSYLTPIGSGPPAGPGTIVLPRWARPRGLTAAGGVTEAPRTKRPAAKAPPVSKTSVTGRLGKR